MASYGGRQPGRRDQERQALLLRQLRLHRPQFPGQNRIVNNTITDPTGNFIPAANCVPTTVAGGPSAAQCTAAINFIQKQMNVLVPRTYNQEIGFLKLDWRPSTAIPSASI